MNTLNIQIPKRNQLARHGETCLLMYFLVHQKLKFGLFHGASNFFFRNVFSCYVKGTLSVIFKHLPRNREHSCLGGSFTDKNAIIESRYDQHMSTFQNLFLFVSILKSGMGTPQRQHARPAHIPTSVYVTQQLWLKPVWATHHEPSLSASDRTSHDVYSEPSDSRDPPGQVHGLFQEPGP